jgi:hypothetical protein
LSPSCSARRRCRDGGVVCRTVLIDQARDAEAFQSEKQAAHLRVAPLAVPSCSPYAARSKRRRDGMRPDNSVRFDLGNCRSKRDGPRIRARCTYLSAGVTGFCSRPRWVCHRLRASRTPPAYHELRPVTAHPSTCWPRTANSRSPGRDQDIGDDHFRGQQNAPPLVTATNRIACPQRRAHPHPPRRTPGSGSV